MLILFIIVQKDVLQIFWICKIQRDDPVVTMVTGNYCDSLVLMVVTMTLVTGSNQISGWRRDPGLMSAMTLHFKSNHHIVLPSNSQHRSKIRTIVLWYSRQQYIHFWPRNDPTEDS